MQIHEFHISKTIIHYLDGLFGPNTLTSWLVSSVGRALHRYRKGHGFKPRTGLNFSTTRISSVFSCEDLLISCYDLIAQQMRLNHLDDVFILLHRQILTDNDKNIDFSKQLGHNVVLIPIYWPPGGFVDVDLP